MCRRGTAASKLPSGASGPPSQPSLRASSLGLHRAGDCLQELWGSPGLTGPLRKPALEGRCAQDTVPEICFSCRLPLRAAAGEERHTFRIHLSGLSSAQTF